MDTEDIVFNVLTFLPVSSIFACSRVCKTWNAVCGEEELWRLYCLRDYGAVDRGDAASWQLSYKDSAYVRFEAGPSRCALLSILEDGKRLKQSAVQYASAYIPRPINSGLLYYEVEILDCTSGCNIVIGVAAEQSIRSTASQAGALCTFKGWNYCTLNSYIYKNQLAVQGIGKVPVAEKGDTVGVYLDMRRGHEGKGRIAYFVRGKPILTKAGSPWVNCDLQSPVYISVDLTGMNDDVRFKTPSKRPAIDLD
eukprot:TRINITY_DN2155_c0_g1_i3.p1 TRINITY_DN2155_c0_g1~~TRINITY_DN2155_c0_g1_i3.p1  ORF type:complete len:252 (+),score=43.98 TRINITY_DN2155_c0_g1_i3:59-814(+)